jgi:hypothetical protein
VWRPGEWRHARMVSGAFTLASLRYPSRCANGLVGLVTHQAVRIYRWGPPRRELEAYPAAEWTRVGCGWGSQPARRAASTVTVSRSGPCPGRTPPAAAATPRDRGPAARAAVSATARWPPAAACRHAARARWWHARTPAPARSTHPQPWTPCGRVTCGRSKHRSTAAGQPEAHVVPEARRAPGSLRVSCS